MYFPYLRGRQFELIALRELVENSLLSEKIIPIVEPVKLSSTLVTSIRTFNEADKKLALVLNPQVGSFYSDLNKEKNVTLKEKFLDSIRYDNIIKTLYLNFNSKTELDELSGKIDIPGMITICDNKDYIPIYEKVFSSKETYYNLIPDESVFRRKIRRNRVILNDKFKKQSRNTDYAEIVDEPFSDDHLYYIDDGYVGFSDYSIIGNEYNETGFAPYAVAIHIVYFDEDQSLRIRHFVSDTNDDISDPAGKFEEAVRKLVEWNNCAELDTLGINTFVEMYKNQVYPGLGTVKKLSLMHHIELMERFLDGEL